MIPLLSIRFTAICATLLCSVTALAYPLKPVRMIVPYPPGGGTDIMARAVSAKLSEIWGMQVVVDNRGGGGTIIGTEIAARSPADGYTLLITSTSFVINPTTRARLPYDTLKDFEPITQVADVIAAPPEQFSAVLRQEFAKWEKVIRATKIRAD